MALEILATTRGLDEHDARAAELDSLRSLRLTEGIVRAARAAMRELAARGAGAQLIPAIDYLIAAMAQDAAIAVLHYDHHFDRLAGVLGFRSAWLAPPGTLDVAR